MLAGRKLGSFRFSSMGGCKQALAAPEVVQYSSVESRSGQLFVCLKPDSAVTLSEERRTPP
jgi:hypothetical protein